MYCYYEAGAGNHSQAGERPVIKIKFSFTGNGLCDIMVYQAVPAWTGIRGLAMEGKLRQTWDALLYGEKLILSEEETTSAGGCGVSLAVFSRPAKPVLGQASQLSLIHI